MKLAIDLRASLFLIASIIKWVGLTLLLPIAVALIYRESVLPFLIPFLLAVGIGFGVELLTKTEREIGVREGFLVVSLVWLLLSLFGGLPYVAARALSPIDAYFEAMSGFTTTGASVIRDIEAQTRSLLFWRGFTQWLGGMGIVVLAVAILPKLAVGGAQLMDLEAPGPGRLERLTPRIRDTARRLWIIYLGLTILEILLLLATGMGGYDAVTHTFTTLSTGGFSPKAQSVAAFGATAQWIIILFMLLGGTNFNLLDRVIEPIRSVVRALKAPASNRYERLQAAIKTPQGGLKYLFRDEEFLFYLLIIAASTFVLLLAINKTYGPLGESLRASAFQVVSIMTTTGFASADFNAWSSTAKMILLVLMFVGGCTGSTGGSIKVIRSLLIFKLILREIRKVIHPQAVMPIRLSGRAVDEEVIKAIAVFAILYATIFAWGSVLILLDAARVGMHVEILDGVSAVAATLGNVGPGFGIVGPMGSYADFPATSKILLIFFMWVGRLEIFPVIVLLAKSYWRG